LSSFFLSSKQQQSEEVSEMPFCSNENQHSEIPENNIFPPRVDNCSKDDNTATYQNEINLDKSLTISHYEFERSKSQNNINLDAPDKTRQESLHQKFGTALEINNGVIQENEINAIKSVECTSTRMCNKTSSKEEIKYHFNESEDEPFSGDASEDEFVPDSLDESDGSITSRSSFWRFGEWLYACKY
jgi:hypothetical protein